MQKSPLKPVSLCIADGISTSVEVGSNRLSLKRASLFTGMEKARSKVHRPLQAICLAVLPWLAKESLLLRNGKYAYNTGHRVAPSESNVCYMLAVTHRNWFNSHVLLC